MNFFKKKCTTEKNCIRKRDRKATELALLKAASHLFAEKGYENTRTLDIAKAAEVNEALILRYFGGKEGLLTALLKDESIFNLMMQTKKFECVDDAQAALFSKERESKAFYGLFKDFFHMAKQHMKQMEQFIRIASSRALVDKEMAKAVQSKIIEGRNSILQKNLDQFFSKQNKKMTQEELEALTILLTSVNYSLNFVSEHVYGVDRKKIDAALDLLSKSLDGYYQSH